MGTQTGVIGVGYEGQEVDSFVAGLAAWEVSTLVDVRLNPISRKRGFSKNALREALEAAEISYIHDPSLGNPKDNREGYGEVESDAGRSARSTFVALMENAAAQDALDRIVEIAAVSRVAVMCFEESELHCHRGQVLKALRDRLDVLTPV